MDIHSEFGDREINRWITIEMDGSKPDCPITFIVDGNPVFSIGSEEIDDFVKALDSIVPN
jgi:hypothetical protein